MKRLACIALLLVCAAAVASCNNNPSGPTRFNCAVGLSLKPPALTSSGGGGTVVVSAASNCAWQATTDSEWITGLAPTTGTGNGEVQFQVSANPDGAARAGNIVLNSVKLSVMQPGLCAVTLSPANQDVPAASSSGTINVMAAADCGWASASAMTWITITSGASGMGNGTVGFSVASNSGAQRAGTIAIGNQTFTVNQADVNAPVCQFTILPATASVNPGGGSVPVTVQAGAACAWTAKSNAAWLSITDGQSGTGPGSVMISVDVNGTGSQRTGTLTIAGLTFTVVQGGI